MARVISGSDGRPVSQGRTYTQASSNPKRFELKTGSYTVEVKQLKGEGAASFKVNIEKGKVVEKVVEWWTALS